MKKSEIIELIESHILLAKIFPRDSDEEDRKFLAEGILDALESKGMLPPSVGIGEKDEYGHFDYICKWESENEEK